MLAHRHYMLDAYGCFVEQANSIMVVNDLLVQLANDLRLSPVMPPFIVPYYYCDDNEDAGISAFCICDNGSHITIHTFPYRSCYFVDILTDEFFGENEVTQFICNQIYANNINTNVVDRRESEQIETVIDENYDFGPHYTVTVENLDIDFEGIYRWLDRIAPKVNMQAISRPYVIYDRIYNPEYISGIVVVAQSHIAFHYSIAEKTANIDIFSCSFLEGGLIEELLQQDFGNSIKINLTARGSKHRIEVQHNSRQSRIAKNEKWRDTIRN